MTKKTSKSASVNEAALELMRLIAPRMNEAQLPPGFVPTTYLIRQSNVSPDMTRKKLRDLHAAGKVDKIMALNKNGKVENYYRAR